MTDLLDRIARRVARPLSRPAETILGSRRIRSKLHRRALRAWHDSSPTLILCYGNINRSPYAEALANAHQPGRVTSAGFYPTTDRMSPERTLAYATSRGIDLGSHRSRSVIRRELHEASAVFVFDLENLLMVALRHPCTLARTHLIGALREHGGVLIADPHGLDDDAHARALDAITGKRSRTPAPSPRTQT